MLNGESCDNQSHAAPSGEERSIGQSLASEIKSGGYLEACVNTSSKHQRQLKCEAERWKYF